MIEVTEFYKSYSHNNNFAVEDCNLIVPDKSVTALLGTNGSGKTTIIKAICAFHYPSKGKITITDKNGNFHDILKEAEIAMEEIGFVPESPRLPSNMTVSDFLHFAAGTHNLFEKEAANAISRVIEDCALSEFLEKKIKTLSKGQQQRLSFAQALIHNPPNLVLDEPISGLDPAQIIQMRKLIKKLSESKAVLMSTHILQEVYSLCNNICIINKGKTVCYGKEKEIIEKTKTKNLEEAFLKLSGGFTE